MISHDHQCIFVHIPKTGGTSVENAIWGPDESTRTIEMLWGGGFHNMRNKYQTGGMQHLLATQIRQEVGSETFDAYYSFAFVRNPWAKVVSQFKYAKTRRDILRFIGLGRFPTFRRYLDAIERMEHVQSFEQWRFVLDDDGTQMVDFIGRFEHLDDDFAIVADRIGLESATLPHDMRSKSSKPWRDFYNDRTRRQVERIYARDIELFEYEF